MYYLTLYSNLIYFDLVHIVSLETLIEQATKITILILTRPIRNLKL